MRLKIIGKNITVTNAMKNRIEDKLGKLDKYEYFSPETIGTVMVRSDKVDQIIEFTAMQSGNIVRGETRDSDFYNAVDSLEELLKRKIRKQKEKKVSKRLRGANKFEEIKNSEGFIELSNMQLAKGDDAPQVVREKVIELNMMTVEEAAEQMELVGHDFYLFRDADTGTASVIYRRRDDNYGVIKEG